MSLPVSASQEVLRARSDCPLDHMPKSDPQKRFDGQLSFKGDVKRFDVPAVRTGRHALRRKRENIL